MPVYIHDPTAVQQCVGDINDLIAKNNGRTISLENDSTARESLTAYRCGGLYRRHHIRYWISPYCQSQDRCWHRQHCIYRSWSRNSRTRNRSRPVYRVSRRMNARARSEWMSCSATSLVMTASSLKPKTMLRILRLSLKSPEVANRPTTERRRMQPIAFIAKLEEPESKGKDLIIYIDDPFSSLDGNHIFFMFSLIEKPDCETHQECRWNKQLSLQLWHPPTT